MNMILSIKIMINKTELQRAKNNIKFIFPYSSQFDLTSF